MQPGQVFGLSVLERGDGKAIDAGAALVLSDPLPRLGQIGRGVDLVDQRMDFPSPGLLPSSSVSCRISGLLDVGAGSFAHRTCPHFRHVLTRSSTLDAATQYGAFPLRPAFWAGSASSLAGDDPEPFVPTPFQSTVPRSDSWHRIGWNFARAYIRTYRRVAPGRAPCCSPFRLRVIPAIPAPWTIPGLPESLDALPHRVARTHLGATGRNPYAFAPIVRARPFPVFGRPVHLPGLLPLITTLLKPFRPRLAAALQKVVDGGSRSAYPCPGFRRRASRASPYLPSLLAGEALPPPSDISPGSRAEWDFNPPDASAVRHTLPPGLTSARPSDRPCLGGLSGPTG